MNINEIAKKVFDIESKEVKNLSKLLTKDFEESINLILNSKGKVIISGMGKSGIIGKKIAATLASTGTPSFFLHPGEAYHGDLGMIEKKDVILLLSNSGETDEVLKVIPFLKKQGNKIISITGNKNSTLSKNSDYHLNVKAKEACPLNLAPTSSTTNALVMGDAIAITLMEVKGFKDLDFAKFHPGGSLGKRLLTNISDIMKTDNLPVCSKETNIIEVIHKISNSGFGMCIIIDKNRKVKGVITDGDIRKRMTTNQINFFKLKAKNIMTKKPQIIDYKTNTTKALECMSNKKVNSLIVTKNNKLTGIIQIYDLGIK